MLENIEIGQKKYLNAKPIGNSLRENEIIGRVVEVHRGAFLVAASGRFISCGAAGSLLFNAKSARDLPTIGDFVLVKASEERGTVIEVLPRLTLLSRIAPGSSKDEQLLAANIDRVLITTSLTSELNLRRIERYLLIAWESGAVPMVVLTKSDLCDEVEQKRELVCQIAMGAQTFTVNAEDAESVESLRLAIGSGQTVVLVGSSGVGKSTLINRLTASALQKTQAVRLSDSKGRHTTTGRSMIAGADGLLIIDTPGMRELQIHGGSEAIDHTFDDVLQLTAGCRFTDCLHESEPGCKVRLAIDNGQLQAGRLKSYLKLERERLFAQRKADKSYAAKEKQKWKSRTKEIRQRKKVEMW